VHRVQHDDAVDAVDGEPVVDQLHRLGMRVLPADEAEPGADELQLRRWHQLPGAPEQLPRVLPMSAHQHAHRGTGGVVQRPEADPLQEWRDLQHVRGAQAGRAPQALVSVAQ
jgi:hypothetical protein